MLYSIVGILVVIIDQAVKFWVQNTLFGTDIVKFIPGVISLVNVHNDGAAFGILSGANARIYFVIVTAIFVILVVLALATNFVSGRLARWSLVMVAAGGVGNMIDRIIYGYVQDMFKVELFNFAIFNVADIFITVFAILFAIAMILEKPDEDIDDELYEDDEEEDEDYEEDEKPARKSLGGKLKEKRQAARSASKKSRQEKYEREYEEYRAQQLKAMNIKPSRKDASADAQNVEAIKNARKAPEAPAPKSEPKPEVRRSVRKAKAEEDPFAAWEKATAKHENERGENLAERAMGTGVRQAQKPQRPVVREVVEPEVKSPVIDEPPVVPAAKPAPAEVQAPVQRKPAAAVSTDDFNLDDILAEFK